jgi:anti-sigma-K factor RskA
MNERMRKHSDFQIDLAAYALSSLDSAARKALEEHLETCAECRELLSEYQQVVDVYAFAAPVQPPPEGALERLLERTRALPSALPPVASARSARYLWSGFAALAALLLLTLGWNFWLQFDSDDGNLLNSEDIAIVTPLTSSENAENASGHLLMDADWKECALVASGLPALSAERDYQLWFVRADGTRVSGAVFHSDDSGKVTVQVDVPDYWRDIERVGVTEEPAGGSPSPTGQNVLLGQFALGS